MLKKLVEKGLAKRRKDGTVRATAYLKYGMLEDEKIVNRYSAMVRGIMNYYSCINRRSDLWKVLSILRKSCALTLAHKHKVATAARIYSKYGPNLTVRNLGKEVASLFYPKSLKTKMDFKTRRGVIIHPSILDIKSALSYKCLNRDIFIEKCLYYRKYLIQGLLNVYKCLKITHLTHPVLHFVWYWNIVLVQL